MAAAPQPPQVAAAVIRRSVVVPLPWGRTPVSNGDSGSGSGAVAPPEAAQGSHLPWKRRDADAAVAPR